MEKHPKILIVGTQPYNKTVQSRAFDSYFHNWEKENLAQVFSDSRIPPQGHCETLYQITDKRLLKRRLHKIDTGLVFTFDELPVDAAEGVSGFAPKHRGSFWHLARKAIWRKRYWNTPKFNQWLEAFKPDIVFLAWSRDFFIFDISIYIAQKFNIPIILSITDDYVFDRHFSLSPLYLIYQNQYQRLVRRLMKMNVYGSFETEKIKALYEKKFGIPSKVQYIATNIKPVFNEWIAPIKTVRYFGNLEAGRFSSLVDVAASLHAVDPSLTLEVYSKDFTHYEKSHFPSLVMKPPLAYSEVVNLMMETDLLVIVEGFKKSDVRAVRYSLSTKVADTLASGRPVLAYGDKDTGAMDFLISNKCAVPVATKKDLNQVMKDLLEGTLDTTPYRIAAYKATCEFFDLSEQAAEFEKFASEIIKGEFGK